MNNSCRTLTGSLESIQLYATLITQRLNAKLIRDSGNKSAKRIQRYAIDIMGNTANKATVTMWVIEDSRDNTGTIKIEHGSEYIEWQSSIDRLCDCCKHNISKSMVYVVCYKAAEPNEAIRTGQCEWYKFSESKYAGFLKRKSK